MKTKEKNTQLLVAERIFNYYLQIIKIKKQSNTKTKEFVIDTTYDSDSDVDLAHLNNKYDGKSVWRGKIGIKDDDNWFTLPGSFREAFNSSDDFKVNINLIQQTISLLLSKRGIANYFDTLNEDHPLFTSRNIKGLYIVL